MQPPSFEAPNQHDNFFKKTTCTYQFSLPTYKSPNSIHFELNVTKMRKKNRQMISQKEKNKSNNSLYATEYLSNLSLSH